MSTSPPTFFGRLARDRSGVALLEFAFTLPIIVLMSLTGAEFTNYIMTRMRISQVALHIADNAARIGRGPRLAAQIIDEGDINDLLTGAKLQAGNLNLYGRGRVILSSLEPVANTNPRQFRIRWQRCQGSMNPAPTPLYNFTGTNIDGMGPIGKKITAMDNGVTMFVEVHYKYDPLISITRAPTPTIVQYASMIVRDRRDTAGGNNGVYPVAGVTPSTC